MATIPVATAMAYLAAGLSCLPAAKAKKRPAIGGWKTWQSRLPTKVEVKAWFSNPHDAICVVSGNVSGNLECMDFDQHGELFAAWMDKVDTELLAKLVIEQTPSGGYHVFYRVDGGTGNGDQGTGVIDGNLKLARGIRDGKEKTLIETRGEGGLFLCAPTEGYSLQQGDFSHLAVIPPDARQALLDAARSLDELPAANCPPDPAGADTGQRGADFAPTGGKEAWELPPGDDFNARGDIHGLLTDAGWQFCGLKPDGNEQWTRPGKDPRNGVSATYKDGSFYVFSSNAAPFEPNVKYSPFAVYATLRHNGDFTAAASALHSAGYGKAKEPTMGVTFNLKAGGTGNGEQTTPQAEEGPISLGTLKRRFPEMRPVLIDGFLRIGETMNIIAAPKTGKSWLVTQLAICVASGTEWFGHVCTAGKVLLIDNELHEETSANRIPLVVEAMRRVNPNLPNVDDMIDVWNLRGKWKSIADLAAWLPLASEVPHIDHVVHVGEIRVDLAHRLDYERDAVRGRLLVKLVVDEEDFASRTDVAEPLRPRCDAYRKLCNEPRLAGLRRGDYVHSLSYSQEAVDEDGTHLRESPLERPKRNRAFLCLCRSLFPVSSSPGFQVECHAQRRLLRLAVALGVQRRSGSREVAVVTEGRIHRERAVLDVRLERGRVR